MFASFKKHINTSFSELLHRKVLVTVSGGVDSVVLARLLHLSKLNIGIAHCNFQLRGESSNQDQAFVEALAKELNCPIYTVQFETNKEAEAAGESIQLTARKLRYQWFSEIASQHDYHFIATAHHLNDSLENYLMHSIRGTGIKGLLGVPEKTQRVIRPLLPFSKNEILKEAKQQNWKWREDASNQKDIYFRNRIRHQVIPFLEKENPNLLSSFQQTLQHLQQSQDLLEDYTALLYNELITEAKNYYSLNLKQLNKHAHPEAVLYQLLNTFGFTDWQSVYDLRNAETGKQIWSETHILEKNRNELLIFMKEEQTNNPDIFISQSDKVVKFGDSFLKLEKVENLDEIAKHIAYLDFNKLKFPLSMRRMKNNDRFYPLGLQNQKKVSHFLKDEKVPTSVKKQTWVLCSGQEIAWVINHRISEKFKVTENTKKCLKISCLKA
jgi:tRNA(Ile)-lysidine synthase